MLRARSLLLPVAAALALTGCGSSAPNPLGAALSYFPSDSPLVMTVATAPGSPAVSDAQQLLARFPVLTAAETALLARLAQLGVDYHGVVHPLFGNPIVVGIARLSGGTVGSRFLAAWVTKDARALSSLIGTLAPGLSKLGSHDGATLYRASTATLAVSGATLLIGSSPEELVAALDLHRRGNGMTLAASERHLAGLPVSDSVIHAFGSVKGLLDASTSNHSALTHVPWVRALDGYGLTITAGPAGLGLRYRLGSPGARLIAAELPFATGTRAPRIASALPLVLGVRDPSQLIAFVKAAELVIAPTSYRGYLNRQATAHRRTGVDLNNLLQLISDNLVIGSDGHVVMARSEMADPAGALALVARLAHDPRSVSAGATAARSAGGGLYTFSGPNTTITLGVLGNKLVISKGASRAQLLTFATAPSAAATGALGAVAFRISVSQLLLGPGTGTVSSLEHELAGTLGVLSGWLAATPKAISGSATLPLR